MPVRSLAAALALAATPLLVPAAQAQCATAGTGARCISVPSRPEVIRASFAPAPQAAAPTAAVGEVLPRGRYSIILNADYYGLPPVQDGWVYMRVGREAYRVDWASHQVLERVTDEAAANF